jgi:hypothetical protein
MAGNFGRKQSFGQKVKGTLRRIFTLSVLGATFVGAPAYYEYGTVKTQEVKIKELQHTWVRYEDGKGPVYDDKIVTQQGLVLENKNSLLHFKFNSADMQSQLSASQTPPDQGSNNNSSDGFSFFNLNAAPPKPKDPLDDPANKVYRVSYYGMRIDIPFIHTYPNLLSVQEVSKDELQARAKAYQDARKAALAQQKQAQAQAAQNGQQNGQPAAAGTAAPAASSAMITFDTVVNGQDVNLTVPANVVDKVKVNSVTPVIPKAPGS